MSPECQLEENRKNCGCTWTSCNKRGKCCECLQSHWRNKELPGCLFPPEIERTYDRSLRTFINYWKNKI
ncbi:MAG: DUF6485 family protein [Candidatus Helarchaeota archaeon]